METGENVGKQTRAIGNRKAKWKSYKCEDVNHFLLQCPLYASERQKLLSVVEQICVVNVQVLLFGSSKHSYDENRVFA